MPSKQVIELPEEDLDAVGCFLEFLYTGEYFPQKEGSRKLVDDPSLPDVDQEGDQLLKHARVYTLAQKFGVDELKTLAHSKGEAIMLGLECISIADTEPQSTASTLAQRARSHTPDTCTRRRCRRTRVSESRLHRFGRTGRMFSAPRRKRSLRACAWSFRSSVSTLSVSSSLQMH